MIQSQLFSNPAKISAVQEPYSEVQAEFGRLIHAAIINKRFRDSLLSNPKQSIETGFCGEKFSFPCEIKDSIEQIHAVSLEDFAKQLINVTRSPKILKPALIHCQ